MIIATFNVTTGWAGRTISYADGFFILEDHGAVPVQALLDYDRQGQLDWAYRGLREWALACFPPTSFGAAWGGYGAAAAPSLAAAPSVTAAPGAAPGPGDAPAWMDARAPRDPRPAPQGARPATHDPRPQRSGGMPGWAIALVIAIAVVFVGGIIAAIAIPALLLQNDAGRNSAVRAGVRSIQTGIESWAADHGSCPDASQLTPSGMSDYVASWPTNPFTGLPMAEGTGPGDFSYWRGSGAPGSYSLTANGADGKIVIRVP